MEGKALLHKPGGVDGVPHVDTRPDVIIVHGVCSSRVLWGEPGRPFQNASASWTPCARKRRYRSGTMTSRAQPRSR
jgi:hypothetical protein